MFSAGVQLRSLRIECSVTQTQTAFGTAAKAVETARLNAEMMEVSKGTVLEISAAENSISAFSSKIQ